MGCNYPRKDNPKLSDLDSIWDNENSRWAVSALSNILALFEANITLPDAGIQEPNTQYSSPTTGFNVQINDNNEDTHLILTPAATLATGTITLPLPANLRDKQIALVNCTQQITALTVSGNGSTVQGAPTSLGADDFFTMKYDLFTTTWYRVG